MMMIQAVPIFQAINEVVTTLRCSDYFPVILPLLDRVKTLSL